MNAGQYEGLMGRLGEILDRMPDRSSPAASKPVEDPTTPVTNRKTGAHEALGVMLQVLDGWIEGAKSNHQASPHRGENRGEECWREFAPGDIRNMVNDAARELGLAEFPAPTNPEENKPL